MNRYTEAHAHAHAQALREALASGEYRVTHEVKSIEYRTVADLKLALTEVQAHLSASERERGFGSVFHHQYSKSQPLSVGIFLCVPQ